MAEYHYCRHRVTDLKHHLIWVPKYRFAVLKGDMAIRCRDLLKLSARLDPSGQG